MICRFFLVVILFLFLGCKAKKPVVSNKEIATNCTSERLESFAQNYRRNFIKDSKLALSEYSELISEALDTFSIVEPEVKEIFARLEQQNIQYKYQSPLLAGWLKAAKSNVEEHIDLEENRKPIISSKPAFAPNAEVLKSPFSDCDRRIIFINEGVTLNFYRIPRTLLNLISQEVLIKSSFSYDEQDKYFQKNIKSIFLEVAALWGVENTDGNLDKKALIWHYVSSVYHFLIAHEYAHDILNHQGNLKAFSMEYGEKSQVIEVNKLSYEWAQELEADYFASNILLEVSKSESVGLPLAHLFIWGGDYFCTFLDYHTFSENFISIEGVLQSEISEVAELISVDTLSQELRQEQINKLLTLYKELTNAMKILANKEIPKIDYQNLDSLVNLIDKNLPKNPNTEDFEKILIDLDLISSNEHISHPPTFIRRAFCRVSILRNSKISSLVKGRRNHGDLYWFNFSKAYKFLQVSLNEMEVDEEFIEKLQNN